MPDNQVPANAIELGTAPIADQARQSGLDRVSFRAETWLSGRGQRPYQTDWVYRDRATAPGLEFIMIQRRASIDVELEPITESIRLLEYRGVDTYGFKIWKAWLVDRPDIDNEVEWGTRTRYGSASLDEVNETEWLAQTVSHIPPKGPIKHGTFVVHFDTRFLPKRVVRFITRKGTLPDLVGPVTEDIPIDRHGVARTEFDNLEAWMTYGIYWWPQQPDS